jgi:FMN-dependent NADH-azoreductase
MQITYCDLCNEPIKINDKKYILGVHCVTEAPEEERQQHYAEILRDLAKQMQSTNRGVQIFEICPECLKVFLRFIHLRKEDLKKQRKEINRIMKNREHRKKKEENNEEKNQK